MPVVLVGHSIGGLTTRLYVGEHPGDVSGVVLLDPTVAAFARMFDVEELQPRWDGTASADQVDQVAVWPDIPFEILRHDPAVYASQRSGAPSRGPVGRGARGPRRTHARMAPSESCPAPGTTSTRTLQHRPSTRFDGCSMR